MSILMRLYESLLDQVEQPVLAHPMPGKRGRDDLRNYQTRIIEIMKGIWTQPDAPPGAIIALEPGAGKTVSSLTVIADLLESGHIRKPLIVAPLLVADTVWDAEIEEWSHLSALRCSKILGTEKQRLAAIDASADIYIINKENLVWLWNHLGRGKKWDFDALFIDEASMLKNGKKRTMKRTLTRFGALAAARKYISGVVELTGTPAPNGLKNLWGLAYIIDQGERLGRTKSDFETRWFTQNKYTYEVSPKPGAQEEITSRLKDIMFSLNQDDYATLPPLIENDITVTLPPKVMEEYRRFKRTLVSDAYDVEAVNAAVLTGKLLQFCLAEDTEVLTDRGWVEIQNVLPDDLVWDGCEWVAQKGCAYMGNKPTVECYGVRMTADHKVLTTEGWYSAEDVINGNASVGLNRAEVRLPHGLVETRLNRCSDEEGNMDVPVRLRNASRSCQSELAPVREASPRRNAELWLQAWEDGANRDLRPRDDRTAPLGHLARSSAQVSKSKKQGLQELWRQRDRYAGFMVQFLRSLLGGRAQWLWRQPDTGQARQQQGLQQKQLSLGYNEGAIAQYSRESANRQPLGEDYTGRSRREGGAEVCDPLAEVSHKGLARCKTVCPADAVAVYDLIDCGSRHRFVVRGNDGPLIVHNCNGSMYQEDGAHVWVHDEKLKALVDLHEDANGMPLLVAYSFRFDLDRIKSKFPKAVVLNEQANVVDTVRKWNAGEIDMLLAHPASAAHGLNLQRGSNISIWYGLNPDLELFQQFNKRLWRSGQRREVVWSHRIIAKGTHDENIMPILDRKDSVQSEVIRSTVIELEGC